MQRSIPNFPSTYRSVIGSLLLLLLHHHHLLPPFRHPSKPIKPYSHRNIKRHIHPKYPQIPPPIPILRTHPAQKPIRVVPGTKHAFGSRCHAVGCEVAAKVVNEGCEVGRAVRKRGRRGEVEEFFRRAGDGCVGETDG